jgi:SAM-dependent methyltransferase
MLPASRERIESMLSPSDVVLDVGGWAKPLARADWVIDLMPFESRGLYGRLGDGPERFSSERWIQRDICDRDPWPFEDGQFDFVVCSHTLEDVRDPVWVCGEMQRVARAGYIEVPSRLEEQSVGVHGPWVGWSHHRWLVELEPAGIEFVFKSGVLQGRPELTLPAELEGTLTAAERVQTMFWEGRLEARERVFIEPAELDRYLAEGVAGHRERLAERVGEAPRRTGLRRALRRVRERARGRG